MIVRQISVLIRDVSAGATGATPVAPKFSDTLTLSQPGGGRFCPPSQRSNLNFPCDYVPGPNVKYVIDYTATCIQ